LTCGKYTCTIVSCPGRNAEKEHPNIMPNHRNRLVVAIIPVHDRLEDLQNLLSSLQSLHRGGINLSIAIVDDGSPSPLRPEIQAQFKHTRLLFFRREIAGGPGAARNLAAATTTSEYIWFLDSDTEIVDPNVLVNMMRILDSNGHIGATGGILEECDGEKRVVTYDVLYNFLVLGRSFLPHEWSPSDFHADIISTSNLFLKRDLFEQAGGFSEELQIYEDDDFCLALRRMGYGLYQDPGTLVWHKLSDAGRNRGKLTYFSNQRLYLAHSLEARSFLLARHAPWRLPVLPVLDAALIPIVFYRTMKGVYVTNRFKKTQSKSKLDWIWLFLTRYPGCYFRGVGVFLRKFFGLYSSKEGRAGI